jgi:hypothetical protein
MDETPLNYVPDFFSEWPPTIRFSRVEREYRDRTQQEEKGAQRYNKNEARDAPCVFLDVVNSDGPGSVQPVKKAQHEENHIERLPHRVAKPLQYIRVQPHFKPHVVHKVKVHRQTEKQNDAAYPLEQP